MPGEDTLLPVTDRFLKIPAAGGRALSARLWQPNDDARYPVILEFSPYRVWDLFRGYGEATFPYWAARGYAVLAVDIAGSGASTGLLCDEYLESEFDDALAVIDWTTRQPWCDGNVGLSGFSWAAFTALRVSDRKPTALKAMVLGGVSEDGWRTDVHYLGGMPYTAQIDWAGVMLMFNALSPDPAQFGMGWRSEWKARLEANTPWIVPWLSHAAHDAFWKEKASKLASDVPLLLYAGLADKYATSVLRIAEQWSGPVRTILGPWEHVLPNLATRGPRIGFLQEALRWWDRWLKGRDNDAMNEAPLRLWVGAPDRDGNTGQGNWRTLDWPLQTTTVWELAPDQLTRSNGGARDPGWERLMDLHQPPMSLDADLYEDIPAPFDMGSFAHANAFMAYAPRQTEDVDIAGLPILRCTVKASKCDRPIVARLIDSAMGGACVRVTTGALALGPGGDTEVSIPFQACGWRLRRGHTLTLVLCANGAPTFQDPPHGTETHIKDIRLSLPVLPSTTRDEAAFGPPDAATPTATEKMKWIDRAGETIAFPVREHAVSRETATVSHHLGATGTDYFITSRFEVMRAWAAKSYRIAFERPGFSIRIDARLEVTSTLDEYQIAWTLVASESGIPIHDVHGTATVPR